MAHIPNSTLLLALTGLFVALHFPTTQAAVLLGETRQWHKLTLVFDGPPGLSESDPETFSDYRLDVTFTSAGQVYQVPGYYAADGDAANSGATDGDKWHCHFVPSATGRWTWTASFRSGRNVALESSRTVGTPQRPLNGLRGSFQVSLSDKTGNDNRRHGMLQYVGKHHLQWAGSKQYFIKTGSDSPENLLAYQDIDGTPNYKDFRKSYAPHVSDWRTGDPTWRGGKGKGLIGAVNYMASMGMNVMSFLTMNVAGDDRNVYPYISNTSFTTFDISKLAQWEIVMDHMDRNGIYLHFKLTETENDDLLSFRELQLYYRELVARFSHHLALNWNIGEENQNTPADRKTFGNLMRSLDPYDHHIVIHSKPRFQPDVYEPILRDIRNGVQTAYTGASLQSKAGLVHEQTIEWLRKSDDAGRPWVVASDEFGSAKEGILPDADTPDNHAFERANTLYANFMAGGAGCESYFGSRLPNSDTTLQDFRSRDQWWKQARVARTFFETYTPFWEMTSMDTLVNGGAWAFGKPASLYVVYTESRKIIDIDLSSETQDFNVAWYNPISGGVLQSGSVSCASGGKVSSIGPPATNSDWVALLSAGCGDVPSRPRVTPTPTTPIPMKTRNPAMPSPAVETTTPLPEETKTSSPIESDTPFPELPPQTPTSPCFGEKDGSVVVQAEDTTLTYKWREENNYTFTGQGYICNGKGNQYIYGGKGKLDYQVVATGGEYSVYGAILRPLDDSMRNDEGNDLFVFRDGVPIKLFASMADKFDEWFVTNRFDFKKEKSALIISLPQGPSTFSIAARSEGLCIDYFELVKVGGSRKGTGDSTLVECGASSPETEIPSIPTSPMPANPSPATPATTATANPIAMPTPTPESATVETPNPEASGPASTPLQNDEMCFGEKDGNIAVQAEMTTLSDGWERMTSLPGFTGNSFITYVGMEQERRSANGVLKYKVQSKFGGKYYIYPRAARLSTLPISGRNRDNNDVWLYPETGRPMKMVSVFRSRNDVWITNARLYMGGRQSRASISLPAGTSYFTIGARSSMFSIDVINLVLDTSVRSRNKSPHPCQ